MQLVVGCALDLGRGCWRSIVVEEVEACLEILAGTIWNEPETNVSRCCCKLGSGCSHLSPYMRGRFRLGLACVGVRSLTRPACSIWPSAFWRAAASIGSELAWRMLEESIFWLRLWVAVGGVLDSGGEIKVGVAASCSACASAETVSPALSRAIAMGALGRGRCGCAVWWLL
jgi:hypothetical protein